MLLQEILTLLTTFCLFMSSPSDRVVGEHLHELLAHGQNRCTEHDLRPQRLAAKCGVAWVSGVHIQS